MAKGNDAWPAQKKERKEPHRNSKAGGEREGATKSRSVWAIDDDEPEPESDSKSDELGALLLQHCDRCFSFALSGFAWQGQRRRHWQPNARACM